MTSLTTTLIPLEDVSSPQLDALLDRAFGPARHERTAYRIREGADWLRALSFALVQDEGRLIGTIQVWPVALSEADGTVHPLLMVGPVAVLPAEQDRGHGRALMAALDTALTTRDPPQMLIGDPGYYGRFGFSADHTGGWRVPGSYDPRRLLARSTAGADLPREGMLGPLRG